ncbi:SMP-30/gluconolactonase/LRE family protein [Pseudarthrobacter sp. N5]|uniref:SMP-30/gluconolactonase/LRE family protein n=1 Tax=Pseudarthrobacter sp. N5 TaxID=3418416 RepID=UPI003CED5AA9
MRRTTQNSGRALRRTALGFIALVALLVPAPLATAAPPTATSVIELPGASSAEGIAAGRGSTFFAGDLFLGDIYRGDVRAGTAQLFIDVPAGRAAVGMKADVRNNLLFVAGGGTGQAYVYDTNTGATVATYQLTTQGGFINDVALTRDGAWFTNSSQGELYFIPVGQSGQLGSVKTLTLTGPAAEIVSAFNLNGIAATPDGGTLIVAHSGTGELYTVNPVTGESALIAGVSVPAVDGIIVQGDNLWAVQNQLNQVSRVLLAPDLSSGDTVGVIASADFQTPTTAALFGNTLAVVNAKFFTPGATDFEVVLVTARS